MVGGAIYASVLYVREKRLNEIRKIRIRSMWFCRFVAVSTLAFFLMDPLMRTPIRETEKPLVVLALDNSGSLVAGKDSAFMRSEFPKRTAQLIADLSDAYDVRTYLFGDEIKNAAVPDFSDKRTDMSAMFDQIETRYGNRNLGALIIAGDGIYNTGTHPLYASEKIEVPVYTIALGDTAVKKDARITHVAHNRLAYLGNQFPLEVVAEAKRLSGKSTTLRVSGKEGVLFTKTIRFSNDHYQEVIPIQLEATAVGLCRYKIELREVEGEVTTANNVRDVYIDVLDNRQKILLLADAPHPDIGALKKTLAGNDNYEVESRLVRNFNGKTEAYNLVILHQLPSAQNATSDLLTSLREKKVPTLFVLGGQTNFRTYNALSTIASLSGFNGHTTAATGYIPEGFTRFNISDATTEEMMKWPPLTTGFGTWKTSRSAEVLCFQRIGRVNTRYPLIAFDEINETKTGLIAGEGIWRWRMQDFARNGSHHHFNTFIAKTVQYLAAKEDKSQFRVYAERTFTENQHLVFDAELYNDAYTLFNEPEVTLNIKNKEGKNYPFNFTKTSHAYTLNAGILPVGEYTYAAKTIYQGKTLTETGEFSVQAIQMELANAVANHQLMYQLAERHGGAMTTVSEMHQLPAMIAGHNEIVPVIYTRNHLTSFINMWWIFWVITGLLTLEWFMRKRNGFC